MNKSYLFYIKLSNIKTQILFRLFKRKWCIKNCFWYCDNKICKATDIEIRNCSTKKIKDTEQKFVIKEFT